MKEIDDFKQALYEFEKAYVKTGLPIFTEIIKAITKALQEPFYSYLKRVYNISFERR